LDWVELPLDWAGQVPLWAVGHDGELVAVLVNLEALNGPSPDDGDTIWVGSR
jgi:hypothetical protein